jgi:hypothetical protein
LQSLYSDLSQRSLNPKNGIDEFVFMDYINLPGLVGENFANMAMAGNP